MYFGNCSCLIWANNPLLSDRSFINSSIQGCPRGLRSTLDTIDAFCLFESYKMTIFHTLLGDGKVKKEEIASSFNDAAEENESEEEEVGEEDDYDDDTADPDFDAKKPKRITTHCHVKKQRRGIHKLDRLKESTLNYSIKVPQKK